VAARALEGETLSREAAYPLISCDADELPGLCEVASRLRDRGKGRTVTFSPKVFIPLTRLCRDFCGYCTFRQSPDEADALFLTLEEVLAVAEAGKRAGCTEALFTLGERPELRYVEAKNWLRASGYRSTLHYLREAASRVLDEVGLLPHLNPGTMSRREVASLRPVSASMGIMLENVSPRLAEPGAPHHEAPSKWPRARLRAIENAGRERVAFTTGLLVGIGESRADRIDSLLAIRDLNDRYGHIQEVIIQNFRAKPDTPMRSHADASTEEMLWTVAAARLLLGERANIQVPPNLNGESYPVFLDAGINDWGGVSPVTIDYVNPEAPWPHLGALRERTEARGFQLKPRLPIYPELVTDGGRLIPLALSRPILDQADGMGFVKGGIERYA
jgi:FO synthase